MLFTGAAALAAASAAIAPAPVIATVVVIIVIFVTLTSGFGMLLSGASTLTVAAALIAAAVGCLVRTIGAFMGACRMLMCAGCMATALLIVTLLMEVRRLPMVMGGCLMMRSRFIMRQTAEPSDLRHVFAIPAHGLAASASRFTCFVRIELVGSSSFMRGSAAHAGDLALPVIVHRCKSAIGSALVAGCHCKFLSDTIVVSSADSGWRTGLKAYRACLLPESLSDVEVCQAQQCIELTSRN